MAYIILQWTLQRNGGSVKDASLDHVTSPTHSVQASESTDTVKKQVQEMWLTILGNFTRAVALGMKTTRV